MPKNLGYETVPPSTIMRRLPSGLLVFDFEDLHPEEVEKLAEAVAKNGSVFTAQAKGSSLWVRPYDQHSKAFLGVIVDLINNHFSLRLVK